MGRKRINIWLDSKICSACKRDVELSCYHKNASKPLGVESRCKQCTSKQRKALYIKTCTYGTRVYPVW